MSGTSEVSRVSTILGGVRDDGMEVICIAQREPSVTFKEFVKTYNPKKMQEFLDEQEADDERRRALRMAWILIEEVQKMYHIQWTSLQDHELLLPVDSFPSRVSLILTASTLHDLRSG